MSLAPTASCSACGGWWSTRRPATPAWSTDRTELATDTLRALHRTIAGVAEDYAALRNNTAVAKLIEYTNHLTKEHRDAVPRAAVEPLVLMLAPLAPHLAEELWLRLGHDDVVGARPVPASPIRPTWSTTPSSIRCR